MSKKSLLYIIIIIFVLTSGFFLASNYKSSIEMKSRGENIVPSVKDVEDIKQPQIEFKMDMNTNAECLNVDQSAPYLCSGENGDYCCDASTYCTSLGGVYNSANGVCYNSQDELTCESTGNVWTENGCKSQEQINCENDGNVWTASGCKSQEQINCENDGNVWTANGCKSQAQINCENDGNVWTASGCKSQAQINCENDGNVWTANGCKSQAQYTCESAGNIWFENYNRCAEPNSNSYCQLSNNNNSNYVYVSQNGSCMDKTTTAYCVVVNGDNNYVYVTQNNSCMSKVTDSYCAVVNGNNNNFVYVTQKSRCMDKTTDTYCSAINGDNSNFIYVPEQSKCMNNKTDAYCIATRGTHFSGGGCRSNADECVALEGTGAKYRGEANEKYSSGKCDSLADQCSRQGKVLYGGVCKTHQEMCEIRKGKWKNGTCISNNNGGNGVSGKTSNKDNNKEDNPKTDDVIGTDATLSNIILSSGRLMFTPGTLDYRVEVSSNVESITIEPVTTDPDATFVVNGDTKLKPGENPFTIVVTAEDGKATLTYNVIIVRTDRILSSNSKASLIEIANHEINFDKDQTDYEVDLTIDEDELDIKVTAEDNLSITEILGNEGLQNGDIVTVKLTAEDGSYTVYAIKVNKEEPFNIKDYIPYIIAGVAGLLLIIVGAAILRGRKSNDSEEEEEFDSKKDKIKDKSKDDVKDDFKMKSKD